MTTLDVVHCEWLSHMARASQNTYELVKHLRGNGQLTPELKNTIADILEDKIRPRPKAKPPKMQEILTVTGMDGVTRPSVIVTGLLKHLQKLLANPSDENFAWAESVLKNRGGIGNLDTKGQQTIAAKRLLEARYGLTQAQLNEILSPRRARTKNR